MKSKTFIILLSLVWSFHLTAQDEHTVRSGSGTYDSPFIVNTGSSNEFTDIDVRYLTLSSSNWHQFNHFYIFSIETPMYITIEQECNFNRVTQFSYLTRLSDDYTYWNPENIDYNKPIIPLIETALINAGTYILYTSLTCNYSGSEQVYAKVGFRGRLKQTDISVFDPEEPFRTTENQNYITTVTPLKGYDAVFSESNNNYNGDSFTKRELITNQSVIVENKYFDGYGKLVYDVQKKITPLGKDLASLIEYNGKGLEEKKWIPVPLDSNDGSCIMFDEFKNKSSLVYNDNSAFTHIIYDSSPLNRAIEQFGAGDIWKNANKRITTDYGANMSDVKYFYANNNNQLVNDGYYASNTLFKSITNDEDGKTVEEYKDKLGQVVLKRSKNGNENIDTYFVYNDLGQLAYVIPPLAADGLTATGVINDENDLLKKYCYLYKYDTRRNCKEKRLPGCEPIYMVYDRADRLVLSQDGNQRTKTTKEWTVTKYDVFGRIIFKGVTTALSSAVHNNLITSYKDELIVENYVNGAYTTSKFADATPLIINYYDDYNFIPLLPLSKRGINYQVSSSYDKAYPATATTSVNLNAKGLFTGTRTYYLDGSGNYTATAMFYDYRGQVVQTRASNQIGGYDYVYNKYNFSGTLAKTFSTQTRNSPDVLNELYEYNYDHANRNTTTFYQINSNDKILLLSNSYDEFGRLIMKKTTQ